MLYARDLYCGRIYYLLEFLFPTSVGQDSLVATHPVDHHEHVPFRYVILPGTPAHRHVYIYIHYSMHTYIHMWRNVEVHLAVSLGSAPFQSFSGFSILKQILPLLA